MILIILMVFGLYKHKHTYTAFKHITLLLNMLHINGKHMQIMFTEILLLLDRNLN